MVSLLLPVHGDVDIGVAQRNPKLGHTGRLHEKVN
jgi:hypothetical protein